LTHVDFLSPDRVRDDLGFRPVLRSSMERRQRDAGATFEEREGWLLPVSFPGEAERLRTVGVADLSHLGKIEVRGPGDPIDGGEATVWYQVAPGRALVLCPYRDCFLQRSTLARRFSWVLDQTGALSILAIVGPEAGNVLRRLTHLHELPSSGAVAHVGAHVLEQNGGYWIVFPQEYGHYLWEVAVDAAAPFGGGPVGVDAVVRERTAAGAVAGEERA
jgi:glycine cleavage system aminomethyltransferase T